MPPSSCARGRGSSLKSNTMTQRRAGATVASSFRRRVATASLSKNRRPHPRSLGNRSSAPSGLVRRGLDLRPMERVHRPDTTGRLRFVPKASSGLGKFVRVRRRSTSPDNEDAPAVAPGRPQEGNEYQVIALSRMPRRSPSLKKHDFLCPIWTNLLADAVPMAETPPEVPVG